MTSRGDPKAFEKRRFRRGRGRLWLNAKGVELQVLAMALDTSTPTGKLMLNLMGSFAEFEREIMLQWQREGVAKAKAEGKYKGWVPTAQRKAGEVIQLRGQGVSPVQKVPATPHSQNAIPRARGSAPARRRIAHS